MKAQVPKNAEQDVLLYRNNSLAAVAQQKPRGRFAANAAEMNESEQNVPLNDNIFENLERNSEGKRS